MKLPETKYWTIDGYGVEAVQLEINSNYNISLHVKFPDGSLKCGELLKEGSTDVQILERAFELIKRKPAEIPGL